MRREERHHLKDNPLATALTRVQAALLVRGRTLAAAGAVVALAAAGAGGYFLWQQQRVNQAGELLADALIVLDSRIAAPPEAADGADESAAEWVQPAGTYVSDEARLEAALERLTAVADAYPGLRHGIAARYEAAGALVALGRLDEASAAYEQVIAAGGDQLHGAVARLGLAETRILGGDAAGAVADGGHAHPAASEALAHAAHDLAMPRVLARLWQLVKSDSDDPECTLRAVAAIDRVLGLKLLQSAASALADDTRSDPDVDALVRERDEARRRRDFARADAIRTQLAAQGIELRDAATGTVWQRAAALPERDR